MTPTVSSTADALAAELKKMINNGSLPDGARLVERELASQFSVSRIPMREAIQQLAQAGMVDIFRNRGAIVRTLSVADIEEIYAIRALLEGDAAFHGAQALEDETLTRIELTHQLLGKSSTPDKQGALNREFHDLVYRGCKNHRLLTMINALRNQVERYEFLQHRLLSDTMKFQQEHDAILNALRARDADAARKETIRHMLSAGKVLTSFLGSRP